MITYTFTGNPSAFYYKEGFSSFDTNDETKPVGQNENNDSTYAQWKPSKNTICTALWGFNIPTFDKHTIIDSVACNARGRGNNGTVAGQDYVGLFADKTVKLKSSSLATSGKGEIYSLSGGTWTYSEAQVCKVGITTKNVSNNSRFYGATLTIKYHLEYTISVDTTGTRGCTVTPLSQSIPEGESGSVTIIPNINATYIRLTVYDNGEDVTEQMVGNVYTVGDIRADHTITAIAEEVGSEHTVRTSGTGCSLSPSGSTTVADGGRLTLSITPNFSRYEITLTDNGTDRTSQITSDNRYRLTNITTDHTIVVTVVESMDVAFLKKSGTWKETGTVYKKAGGVWTDKTEEVKTLFERGLFVV